MATITSILPNILAGVDIVGAEKSGLITAVGKDISVEGVAKGQTVNSIISSAKTAADSTPSAYLTSVTDSVTAKPITISKDRSVTITLTGDEELGLGTVGGNVLAHDFAQAIRALRNEVEADLAALYASGTITAIGTAGTTPFTSMSDFALVRKALVKAGAPDDGGYRLVVDPSAYANMIQLSSVISNANSSVNSAATLGGAVLPKIYNIGIGESAQILGPTTPAYMANMFFHSSAIQLVARLPKFNSNGDAAVDRTVITDPQTGLNFSIAAYPQHRQMTYEVGLAWGVGVIRPEFIGVIKG